MKSIFLLLISMYLSAASLKEQMLSWYEIGDYEKVCNVGFSNLSNNKQDEEFLSLYSFGCLNSDQLDRLIVPSSLLKYSKDARANSAYFSVVLMQKKLLYYAMVDGYSLTAYNMPSTDYVLSKVFDQYAKLKKHEPKHFYLFNDIKDSKKSYKLYLLKDGTQLDKIVIEELVDSMLVKKHIYW